MQLDSIRRLLFTVTATVMMTACGGGGGSKTVNFTIDAIANTSQAENSAYTSVTPSLSGDAPIGTVTYTLGGADASAFSIDASTGVVSMVARDYEAPVDANTDNVYEVSITATDSDGNSDSEDWTVTVTKSSSPILSSVTIAPDSAAAGLTISLSGSFSFMDPNGDLNGGSFNYIYNGTTYSFEFPANLEGMTSGDFNFGLEVALSSNIGTENIPCWLVDNAGHSSNTVYFTFDQLWTRMFGTIHEDVGYGIAIDNSDNVIVTGTTYGDLDEETNLGASDVFLTKYTPDANWTWTRLIGSSDTDNGRDVAVDNNNNIYITGDTTSDSFDGQVTTGPVDGFLTKFDAAGNRIWTRLIGSISGAYTVATDTNNNIYVAGKTHSNLDGETNTGSNDAFLIKFNTNGTRLWTRLLGTTGSESAYSVVTDNSGNIYITGGTDGVLGTDPSPGDAVINYDSFVAKYNTSGTLQWITQQGTSCSEWSKDIAVDASSNIYLVGKIYQCAFPDNTANGRYDAFLSRLDSSGNTQWIRQFGTEWEDSANGVTTDSAGNAYVTGYLDSSYFTDDSEGNIVFLAKYDASGTQAWLAQDNFNYSWGNQGLSVATDSTDNIFLTGTTHGSTDQHSNSDYGEDEVFILTYDPTGVRR